MNAIIGTRIKEIRKANNYSRQQFAHEFDLPYSTLTNYENGTRKPPYELLLNIAKTLGTTVDYLLGYTDDPKQHHGKNGEYGETALDVVFCEFMENIGYKCYFGLGDRHVGRHYIADSSDTSAEMTKEEYERLRNSIIDYAKYTATAFYNAALVREKQRMENEMLEVDRLFSKPVPPEEKE